MSNLTLDSVTKVFDDDGEPVVAVDDVTIDIEDGEFLVLVGPSGCGKSTTLRMIAGLETVTEGDIRLGGTRINDRKPKDRDIAMVFQSYALYPHMSVAQNMRFGLEESTDMPDDEIEATVTDTAEMLDIGELLDRKPSDLSGGQQQRVALGRAIVRDPEVFLMDEPLSNLDAKLRAQMRTELQHLQEELGVTTVYVTHDQTEAMTMGDKIAVLDDGKLQQVGTPLECYHEPSNLFVAGFMGEPSMNFFEVERQGTRLVADGWGISTEFSYPLTDELQEKLDDETELTLGIRPEDIELRSSVESPHDFETVIDVVEPMGDENAVHLQFEVEPDDPTLFTATTNGMISLEAGQDVVARIPPEAVHIFDRETGQALCNRSLENVQTIETTL